MVGTGFFSGFHLDAWQRIPEVELVGLCARSDRERAREAAEAFSVPEVFLDIDEMLDAVQPDLVDIVTPPRSHLEIVSKIAQHGIPMLCQKPLAPDLAESIKVVEVAEQAETLFIVNENWRFRPWFREVRRLLDAGLLGVPEMVKFSSRVGDGRGPDAYMDRQPRFREMPKLLIHESGIHMVDCYRYLIGEVDRVLGHLWRQNPIIQGEDSGYVLFDFVGGAHGLFDGNRLGEHDAENMRLTTGEMVLEGSEAYIRLDGDGRLWLKPMGERERQHHYEFSKLGFGGDSVHALHQHVVAHLVEGAPVENTGRDFLQNSYVEDAIYRSYEQQEWIAVTDRSASVSPGVP